MAYRKALHTRKQIPVSKTPHHARERHGSRSAYLREFGALKFGIASRIGSPPTQVNGASAEAAQHAILRRRELGTIDSSASASANMRHFVVAPSAIRRYLAVVSEARREFWSRHPGLVWSNPNAGDEIFIRAALLRPRFSQLLEIAAEFGPERLRSEWAELALEETPEFRRARPVVERILRNIEKGAAIAAAGN